MMIATISDNGNVTVATALDSLATALDWLIGQSGRFGRIGSLLMIETVDGRLIYSVSVPWQND
jgi:hypothetical protein